MSSARSWAFALGLMIAPTSVLGQSNLMDRPANVEVSNVTLETGLTLLSQRSSVPIAFSPDLTRAVHPVSCSCADLTVREALDSLLATTDFEYEEMRARIVVRPKEGVSSGRDGRRRAGEIVGVVRAAVDSQPIPAARVGLAYRVGEVLTDARGHFRLSFSPGAYNVTVRAMGYRPGRVDAVVRAGSSDTMTVFLRPAPISLEEIVVTPSTYGILKESNLVGSHTLTREEVQARPHLGEDVFRAVDRLPGVATHDITAKFHVRGGPHDQVLTTLDGLELYEPFHLRDAEAALSIIDVESVSNIDLITGGFSVEYGDKLAGVFTMETTAPPPDRMITTLGLSIQNVSFKNQGSFSAGRGSWLVSARRGYLDLILDITDAPKEGASFSPTYYDAFAKTNLLLGSRHRLSAQALHAGDEVSALEEDGTTLESSWRSSYVWLTWGAEFTERLSSQTIVSTGRLTRKRIGSDFWNDTLQLLAVDDRQRFHFFGVKQDWTFLVADDVLFKWGVDFKRGASDYGYARWIREWVANATDPQGPAWSLSAPDSLSLVLEPTGSELGSYLSMRARPVEPFTFEVGVRYDRQTHTGDRTLAPRVNVVLEIAPRTTVRGAWGYFYQSQGLHELRVADGEHLFNVAQRAEHRILGLQHQLYNGIALRIEAYERRISDPIPEFRSLVPQIESVPEEGPEDRIRIDPTRGLARGIELSADYDVGKRIAWSVSYALASAKDELDGQWFPRPFDQRHTIQIDFAYRPNRAWSLGWAWQYHSPWPGTPENYSTVALVNGDVVIDRRFGTPYGNRMPAYHRMDARVMRHFPLGRGRLSVFLDVFNVYDRENALAWDYVASTGGSTPRLDVRRNFHQQIGVLPTAGARWEF